MGDFLPPELHQALVCNFRTTTPHARLVSQVVMMEAVQQYFDYRVYCICGIPRVTVAGLPNEPYVDNEAERLGLRRMHLKVVAKGLE